MAYCQDHQDEINKRFWEACKMGERSTFIELLADVNLTTPVMGGTPLVATIHFRQFELMKDLMKDPRIDLNSIATSAGEHTVLHWAVMCGNVPAVRILIQTPGVEINKKNGTQDTPLMLAVRCKNAAVVEVMLGADRVELEEGLEEVAHQWMHSIGRKDSDFRSEMSRIIMVLLGRARDADIGRNGRRARRDQARREAQERQQTERRIEQERLERREQRERNRREQEVRERERRERMVREQRRREQEIQEQREREQREEDRREQERREASELVEGILRDEMNNAAAGNEEGYDLVRRQLARMELRESIEEAEEEEVARVVAGDEEEDENDYVVLMAGGEREDRIDSRLSPSIPNDSIIQLHSNKFKISKSSPNKELSDDDKTPVDVHDTVVNDSDLSLNDSVDSLSKSVDSKIESLLLRLEDLNKKTSEREADLKNLYPKQDKERKELKEKQTGEENEYYISFTREVKSMKLRQEERLEEVQRLDTERELDQRLHHLLHMFEHEEEDLQQGQEEKLINMFIRHKNENSELKGNQTKEMTDRVGEDKELAELKNKSKKTQKLLNKLTNKPEVIPCPECPVCYESMKPPLKILQCVSGHLVCVDCARKVEQFICPTCKQEFAGRATAMEQFLRTLFCQDD